MSQERRIYLTFRNGGHFRIRPGDCVLFKPHVRRSLYLGVKSTKAYVGHFAGLAVDTFCKGETGRVQVYGDPAIAAKEE